MKVKGTDIPQALQDEVIAFMKDAAWFRAQRITGIIERALELPSTSEIPFRVADRIIQRERAAGNIRRMGSSFNWEWAAK